MQIQHPSGDNMMERIPREDVFFFLGFALGKTILPQGSVPSCDPHLDVICVLLYQINPTIVKYA